MRVSGIASIVRLRACAVVGWGIYSGYFRDPHGHLWEIIWNPRDAPPTVD